MAALERTQVGPKSIAPKQIRKGLNGPAGVRTCGSRFLRWLTKATSPHQVMDLTPRRSEKRKTCNQFRADLFTSDRIPVGDVAGNGSDELLNEKHRHRMICALTQVSIRIIPVEDTTWPALQMARRIASTCLQRRCRQAPRFLPPVASIPRATFLSHASDRP